MADNKETNQTAEHQCHECAKFLKKGCINLFPLRVKPTARACKSFIDPVSADKTYCKGYYYVKVSNQFEDHTAVMTCLIKDRCARCLGGKIPDYKIRVIEAEECTKHGYPNYIRKEKNR